jgi:hypothetical protein
MSNKRQAKVDIAVRIGKVTPAQSDAWRRLWQILFDKASIGAKGDDYEAAQHQRCTEQA